MRHKWNLLPYLALFAVVSTILFTQGLRTIVIKGSSLNTFFTIFISQHPAPRTSSTRHTATYAQIGTESTSHDALTAISSATNILSNQTKKSTIFGKPNPTRVMIVAYFRSGSTLLGELLSWIPDTYYSFEPLHQFSNSERLAQRQVPRALEILSDIISCNFSNSPDYLADLRKWDYSLQENRLLWSRCFKDFNLCVDPQFITAACRNASFWVMKLTRVNVRDVHQLMMMNKDIADTVKVVHLVRDPRGILQSRRKLEWCEATCISVNSLCEEMRGDMEAFEDLLRDFPGSALRLKYEDLVQNLPTSAEELLSQLGQTFTEEVQAFIKTRSSGVSIEDLSNPHSTKRNAAQSASQWKYRMKVPDILAVQDACNDVIQRLGYDMLEDA